MRTTGTMLINNMINYISTNQNRMASYQYQLATGKKIRVPSDDPVVAARALKLRTDVAEIEQYNKNVEDAKSWLEVTETALDNIGEILHRANELAVQAANGPNTVDETQKIKTEIDQLKEQLIQIANTDYNGRYIFSGFQTDKALLDKNGNFAIGVSKSNKILYEVGIGESIDINVTGGDLFNVVTQGDVTAPPPTAQPEIIKFFEDFSNALNTDDKTQIQAAIGNIKTSMDNVLRVRAEVGAKTNRLDLTKNRLESDSLNFTGLMSKNEDIDEAETIMLLKNEENVYRASLAGGARIIQPSLVDFLR